MAIDPEELEPRKKKATPWAQEDLSFYSIDELKERIASLEAEVKRCRALIDSKHGSRAAADAVFKKPD
jgi:uncharacterized small protein (DUF1192 family)